VLEEEEGVGVTIASTLPTPSLLTSKSDYKQTKTMIDDDDIRIVVNDTIDCLLVVRK
jgi:hypothetical protein